MLLLLRVATKVAMGFAALFYVLAYMVFLYHAIGLAIDAVSELFGWPRLASSLEGRWTGLTVMFAFLGLHYTFMAVRERLGYRKDIREGKRLPTGEEILTDEQTGVRFAIGWKPGKHWWSNNERIGRILPKAA